MKPLFILDSQVRRVAKNSYRELTVTFRHSPEDYTQEIEQQLFDLFESGKVVKLVCMDDTPETPFVPFMAREGEIVLEKTPQDEGKDEKGISVAGGQIAPLTIAQKRQRLALLMNSYALRNNIDDSIVLHALYARRGITSRTQLSDEQLDEEIGRYKMPDEYEEWSRQ